MTNAVRATDGSGMEAGGDHMVRFGAYALDPLRHVLLVDAREVTLSPLASQLLQLLAADPGVIVERSRIIDDLWRGDWLVGDPALNRVVSEIRRAVGEDKSNPTLIQTVPRRGYRIAVTAMRGSSPPAPVAAGPKWSLAWRLANRTLLIAIGGFALLLALAILARHFR